MTNANENRMIRQIDKAANDIARPAVNPRRAMYLRMQARLLFRNALADLDCQMERAALVENILDMAAEHLPGLIGRVEAATAFNSRSTDICATFKLKSAIAGARAEQEYAKLTAANDRSKS